MSEKYNTYFVKDGKWYYKCFLCSRTTYGPFDTKSLAEQSANQTRLDNIKNMGRNIDGLFG